MQKETRSEFVANSGLEAGAKFVARAFVATTQAKKAKPVYNKPVEKFSFRKFFSL